MFGENAFGFTGILEIIIPKSVRKIEKCSFAARLNLTNVTFPSDSQLETFGIGSFGFNSLEEISVPSSVMKIKENAFSECYKNLKKLKNGNKRQRNSTQ